jgi:hypothetical protein
MKFEELFGRSTSRWIKYNEYDCNQAEDGKWYIHPKFDSVSAVYDPIENVNDMLVEALNIGLKCMSSAKEFYDDNRMIAEICCFAEKYGLLGFMTALPTTPEFMDYETAYFPKNRFIRAESMKSADYAKIFFPFEQVNKNPNPHRHYRKDDGSIMVSLAARTKPKAIEMCYQKGYTESYDWLRTQFTDWALMFAASFLYYDLAATDPEMAELQRQAIAAFDGNVPSFHIELFDKPTLVWDFKSLMTVINVVLGIMLTDDARPLRSCKYCNRAFIATHPKAEFCGHKCKNKFNVYKSRGGKPQ